MRFPGLRLLLFGAPRSASSIRLGHRRIFILPTRLGLGFGLLLGAMLLTAMNYQNNLAYAFVFLTASAALTSALHTYANLAGIILSPGRAPPVFAGQQAAFPVRLAEKRGTGRVAIEVAPRRGEPRVLDLEPYRESVAEPAVTADRRGLLPAPELVVRTTHPLGLFRVWSRARFDQDCLVYPSPARESPDADVLLPEGADSGQKQSVSGEEDLDSLRQHRQGESSKRIDWKAYARGRGLMSKHFSGPEQASVWLDFDALSEPGTETRLSVLARMILDLDQAGTPYGLKLPHTNIPPDSGRDHMHACLAELALFYARGRDREDAA
ncbi:MAG: DUF58 domain-containing protein [Desulfohalobiaceae bacterium]|nr:DUF58 domain-containing protein [Desulfohalobiaceae bacterium]